MPRDPDSQHTVHTKQWKLRNERCSACGTLCPSAVHGALRRRAEDMYFRSRSEAAVWREVKARSQGAKLRREIKARN
eukprot:2107619-Pleurochrysis_carterae.AAC.1